MSEFDNTPIVPSSSDKPGPAGWFSVWVKVITKPGEQTFVEITESPLMSAKTAYLWVFLVGTISGIIQAIAASIRIATGSAFSLPIPGLEQYIPQSTAGSGNIGLTLISGLCASPLAGVFSVIVFALLVAIVQWIAKLFGGKGTYEKLLYAFAAISVPFTLVSSVFALFSSVPFLGACLGLISFGLSLYAIVLQVMAVKGVNRFGWGEATGSVFIPGCVVFIVCACVLLGGFMLLGPVIKNAFDQINQSLQFAP